MLNKKIASEIAVVIILLLAIVLGGIFWLQNKKINQTLSQTQKNISDTSTVQQIAQNTSTAGSAQSQIQVVPEEKSIKSAYEKVEWLAKSRIVSDVSLFLEEGDNNSYALSEIGEVKSGEFANSRILLAIFAPDGPGGASVFRFIQKPNEDQLYFLKDYSSSDFYDSYGFPGTDSANWNLNRITFPEKNYASSLKIASLEYPEILAGPNGGQLKKEDDYPVEKYIENPNSDIGKEVYDTDLNTKLLKFVFADPVYGDVYTTDAKKITDVNKYGVFAENGFYVKAPGESFKIYSAIIDLGKDFPNITWNDGTKNSSAYSYQGESGCGTAVYADVMSDLKDGDLIVIGKTSKEEPIYGLSNKNSKLLKDYYEIDLGLAKDNNRELFSGKKFNANMSYDDFLSLHPMFFWRDPFGRLIRFLSYEVMPLNDGCGKPVIYLYPQQTENIFVKVSPTAGMSVSDPVYNSGWNVSADPFSNITNYADGKTYPYLFWEGSGKDIYKMPTRGFVVADGNLGSFFDDKLAQEGLIQKEINDFKDFWIPKMSSENKPYYFVTFVDRATIDKLAPIDINPKPDTTIRVLMDYNGLDKPIAAQGFEIKTPKRSGFTVVEWGGVLR